MAPPLVPELLEDTSRKLGEPPWIKGTREGLIGHRDYLLRTLDEDAAYDACFAIGSPWSVGKPSLLLGEKTTRRVGGKDSPDTGTGGATIVSCEYATPRLGKLPPPTINTKYTLLSNQDETANIYTPISTGVIGPQPPIANGDGASRLFGCTRAKVYTYYPVNANIAWSRFIDLQRFKYTNDAALQLPPILGTTTQLNFAIGQLRYESFGAQVVNSFLEVTHELSMAEDFLFRWYFEDENGFSVGSEIPSVIYKPGNLGGLW